MELAKSIEIVRALAQGVDPLSGETLPPHSPYETPDVIRALHTLLDNVKTPARPRLSPEDRQASNLAQGRPRNAGLPWTDELRRGLAEAFRGGVEVATLADEFGRTPGSIIAELKRQELISLEEARALQGA